jgi:hypothetical protein
MASIENKYVGNGTTVLYSFTFPYINESDIYVSVNDTITTEYTLANATTIEFNAAPASGAAIRIYRSTNIDSTSAEFFPGSAIRAQDLNDNFEQTLFAVQESASLVANSDAATVVGIANEALTTANQAKSTADSVSGIANQALTEAGAAQTTANQASSDAATAISLVTSEGINVKGFGAVGDGVTDDYAAITQAIAASAGQLLIFPEGTYSVTQTIVFDQNNSVIRGTGSVIITMPDYVNRDWSVGNIGKSIMGVANGVAPVENVLLENITFDFNSNRRGVTTGTSSAKDDAFEKNAFTVANAKNITIRDCQFLNGFRHCLDITTPTKKGGSFATDSERLLQMPVLPNIGGTEVFGAQYITIENCYFAGGGDDNLTTHYCSNVYITNCRSESPFGAYGIGPGNNNGFEIDDGSRNIILSDCTAIKCSSAIEVKAHDSAPAPYNIIINGLQAINCASSIEIHHSNWDGPAPGNPANAYNVLLGGAPGTVTLAAGTPQEVVCVDGISPMARNVSVSNVQVIAPTKVTFNERDSNNNYTQYDLIPDRCFEVGGYDGVQVSNILFNDGRSDTALSDVDGFDQPVVFADDIGLIHLHDGCRNVSFSNVQVTGFGGAAPLTNRVFEIVSNCFDAINCSNLTVVDGPNQIVEATGSSQAYFGSFRGVVARSSVTMAGPALNSSNNNLRFEQPDITGYTDTINVQEVVLEKSAGTPSTGRGVGSVHVDTNTGVLRTKTTGRTDASWNSLGALAWVRYSGTSDTVRAQNNIESIVKNSTGSYTVTLSPDLVFNSDNDFCICVTSSQNANVVTGPTVNVSGQASFTVNLFKTDGVTPGDSGFINIIVFGETI